MRTRAVRTATIGLVAAALLAGCNLTEPRGTATTELDLGNSLRPGLVGMPDYPSSGWDPEPQLPSTPVAPSRQNPLAGIGLRASDLQNGSAVSVIADGTSLGVPTLDFCEGDYPSEALRVKRLQSGAFDKDGNYAGLSTEVVVYESAKAARQALAEVTAARLACPTDKTVTTYDGHRLRFAFHPAPGPSSTPLVDADSRLIVHTTMQVDGAPQTAFLVYQIEGKVLAALYASNSTGKPVAQATLDRLYGLAGRIADRLRAYTDGTPATGKTTAPSTTNA